MLTPQLLQFPLFTLGIIILISEFTVCPSVENICPLSGYKLISCFFSDCCCCFLSFSFPAFSNSLNDWPLYFISHVFLLFLWFFFFIISSFILSFIFMFLVAEWILCSSCFQFWYFLFMPALNIKASKSSAFLLDSFLFQNIFEGVEISQPLLLLYVLHCDFCFQSPVHAASCKVTFPKPLLFPSF